MSKRPTVLMILDGYGLNENIKGNAVAEGKTPVMDQLMKECPFVKGNASGMAVGLPEGLSTRILPRSQRQSRTVISSRIRPFLQHAKM